MTLNQLSVFIENRPGSLSSFAHLLKENNIDMLAVSIADVQDYGILRLIVEDVYKTSEILKNAGYVFRITPTLGVPIADRPGGLGEVLDILGGNNINIEYLYAFVGRRRDKACVIFRVADEDIEKATRLLGNKGFEPLEPKDL